ncbi:phage portal protein [Ruegeria atlantica]|uniref:phage portal protein n=1 Tax=Ruegeria atlantica TaxID=81569 RepID=UPI00147AC0BB|nr:phage portal protein [Ruegeria atlantica]
MADIEKRPGLLGRWFGRAPDADPARVEPKVRHQVRRFKAARGGRLVGGFGNILGDSSRSQTRMDLRGLVNHARVAAQNVDYLKSYEMMVRRHVVGWNGISLQMNGLNPNGEPDRLANTAIENAWKDWGKRGNCTPCGRLSWWKVEKVAATMLAREGNFLLRELRGRAFGKYGYQVQPISIDLLDLNLVQTLSDGRYIDGGVEFNKYGRPLAFHMFDGHPMEAHTGRTRHRLRIPADQVIHVIRETETGQALGVPESHTALRRFNMLAKYEESAQTAAHYGASAMVFLEKTDPDGAPMPAMGDDEEEIPEEMEAGSIVDLPPGYTVKGNPSNYPDANMPGFMKSMIRGGAAGLGVSYAGLSSDMEGANFSSLKDGRGEERDEWRVFQRDLSEGLHDPVFQSFLPMALLAGRVRLPNGTPLPVSRSDKFEGAATWRGRGWASVNPKDDAVANDKDLANGLRAPSDIVAERGEDFEQLAQRLARDLRVMEDAGLPLPSWHPANSATSPPISEEPGDGKTDPENG